MALNKAVLSDKLHYSGTSGGGVPYGYGHSGGGGGHVYSSIGHSGYGHGGGESSYSHKGGQKKSVALSALTLLAFLFFLHILQTCLEEQSAETTTTTNVVVMAARTENQRRKGDENLDGEYSDNGFMEKKSSLGNWEEDKKKIVSTRIKTFTKLNQPDHV